jgi:hypothetical protein
MGAQTQISYRRRIAQMVFVVLMPILYVAMSGPLLRFSFMHDYGSNVAGGGNISSLVSRLYEPLFRIAHRTKLREPFKAYLLWWGIDIWNASGPPPHDLPDAPPSGNYLS